VIKLDIVNAVVAKTSVTRTKAEQAVETVFRALKDSLGRGQRIELRRFGVLRSGWLPAWPQTVQVQGQAPRAQGTSTSREGKETQSDTR